MTSKRITFYRDMECKNCEELSRQLKELTRGLIDAGDIAEEMSNYLEHDYAYDTKEQKGIDYSELIELGRKQRRIIENCLVKVHGEPEHHQRHCEVRMADKKTLLQNKILTPEQFNKISDPVYRNEDTNVNKAIEEMCWEFKSLYTKHQALVEALERIQALCTMNEEGKGAINYLYDIYELTTATLAQEE